MACTKRFLLLIVLIGVLPLGCIEKSEVSVSLGSDFKAAVRLNKQDAQVTPTQILPIVFDVQFSEPIRPETFTVESVGNLGSANVLAWQIEPLGDDQNFILRALALDSSGGSVQPEVRGGLVRTKSEKLTDSSVSFDNTVIYDVRAPNVPNQLVLTAQPPAVSQVGSILAPILNWTENDPDVDYYEAQIVAATDLEIVKRWTRIKSGQRLDTNGMAWDRTYQYRLRAVDRAGNVSQSVMSPMWHNESVGLTKLEPIGVLPGLSENRLVCISGSKIVATYDVNTASHFVVYEKTSNGWVQKALMRPPDFSLFAGGKNAGCAIVGDRIFMGRPGSHVYVYDRQSDGSYPLVSQIKTGIYPRADGISHLVAIDARTFAVGFRDTVILYDGQGQKIGEDTTEGLKIFRQTNENTNATNPPIWAEQAKTEGYALYGFPMAGYGNKLFVASVSSSGYEMIPVSGGNLGAAELLNVDFLDNPFLYSLAASANALFTVYRAGYSNGSWSTTYSENNNVDLMKKSCKEIYADGDVILLSGTGCLEVKRFNSAGTSLTLLRDLYAEVYGGGAADISINAAGISQGTVVFSDDSGYSVMNP